MPAIDIGLIATDAAAAITGTLSTYGRDIAAYAKAEATKIATSLAEIAKLRAGGEIDDEEMALLIDIQKHASRAVFMAIKGIGIIAAEQAVNAAIGVVTSAVNTALGRQIF